MAAAGLKAVGEVSEISDDTLPSPVDRYRYRSRRLRRQQSPMNRAISHTVTFPCCMFRDMNEVAMQHLIELVGRMQEVGMESLGA